MTQATLQPSGTLLFPLCDDIHVVNFTLIKDQIKKTGLFNKFTLGKNIAFVWERRRIQTNESC